MNVLSVLQGTSPHQMLVMVVMPALRGSIILSAIKHNVKLATQGDSPLISQPQLALTAILVSMLRTRQLPIVFSASLGTTVTKGAPQNAKSCLEGTFMDLSGASTCTMCKPGYYVLARNSLSCKECYAGQYQDEFGSVAVSIAKLVIFVQMTKHQIVVIHLIVFRAQLVRI